MSHFQADMITAVLWFILATRVNGCLAPVCAVIGALTILSS